MAKVYYKATRPDGLDFYSGTVDYGAELGSGKRVKVRAAARDYYSCCTAAVLHAADVPTETLVGGSWPCRLFEVTGRPVAQKDHKYGFRSLRVVRELPAHDVFGPQGVHVVALVERAGQLTAGEVDGLYEAWDADRYTAWSAARDAARYAAWIAAGDAARDAARDAASALLVRDLISPKDYDTLTLPWRTAVGRLHPDDRDVANVG